MQQTKQEPRPGEIFLSRRLAKVRYMKRYDPALPRTASVLAAIAMAVITMGGLVVLPAEFESVGVNTSLRMQIHDTAGYRSLQEKDANANGHVIVASRVKDHTGTSCRRPRCHGKRPADSGRSPRISPSHGGDHRGRPNGNMAARRA